MPDLRERVVAMEKRTEGQWSRLPKADGTISVSIRTKTGDTIFGHGATTEAAMTHLEKRMLVFYEEQL